ncbi:MAG TPA: hypothetical protein VGI96_37445 [Streptosporangiaceae bacterium]|jgi:hypothetical protein
MDANPDQAGRQRDVTAARAALGLADGDSPPRTLAQADGPLRVVPVGRRISLVEAPGAAELYVLTAVGLPGMLALPVTLHRPADPAEPDPHQQQLATTDQLTAFDDRDRAYQVHFSGTVGPDVWNGHLDLHPEPASGARWADVGTTAGPEFRVDLAASASAAGRAAAMGPASPGDALLTAIAENLLATGGQDHPVPGRGVRNLGAVVDALTAAGALSPDSPLPGRLATLAQRLGRPGHGIGAAARDDLPETWASLLAGAGAGAGAGARAGAGAGAGAGGRTVSRNAAAPVAAVLPAVDGARFALAGLVTGPDGSTLQVVGTGLFTPGWDLPVAGGVDHGFSWWLRTGGADGQWHVAVVEEYQLGTHGEIRFGLGVHPALSPEDGDLEVMVTGPTAQVRVRLPLRWNPLPW